ncbi:DUF4148 domain-containing protein [Collimonas antrihumi]|uniref:DUF4148 domain-containing protein n=1 Tax=Collimonas antrihumi TaxID=1940615 RepID=UPI001B8B761C|nr:DUF4148 domain-containing protein [Collimonas antrihumi]
MSIAISIATTERPGWRYEDLLCVAYNRDANEGIENPPLLTRAQVQSELARARAAGELDFAGSQYPLEANTGN